MKNTLFALFDGDDHLSGLAAGTIDGAALFNYASHDGTYGDDWRLELWLGTDRLGTLCPPPRRLTALALSAWVAGKLT